MQVVFLKRRSGGQLDRRVESKVNAPSSTASENEASSLVVHDLLFLRTTRKGKRVVSEGK